MRLTPARNSTYKSRRGGKHYEIINKRSLRSHCDDGFSYP